MVNTQTSTEARSRLAEIQARQRQAVRAGCHPPRWFLYALAGMLAVFYLAAQEVDSTGAMVALTVGFAAGMGGLSLLLARRAPVQVHPSQYVRSRFWLAMVGSGVAMGVIVLVVSLVTPDGLPEALAMTVAYLLVAPVLHRVSYRWMLRRGPAVYASDGGGSADGAEDRAERVAR